MKVLFFTPFFGNTGSETNLFYLLSLAKNQAFEVGICVIHGEGSLTSHLDFPFKNYNYPSFRKAKIKEAKEGSSFGGRLKRLLLGRIMPSRQYVQHTRYDLNAFLETTIDEFKPDLCYVNTLSIPEVMEFLSTKGVAKVILHTHELENMLSRLSSAQLKIILAEAKQMIVPTVRSAAMFSTLGRNSGVTVMNSALNFSQIAVEPEKVTALKKLHQINDGDFIWIMSGTIDPNKDAVAFLELARIVSAQYPLAKFMWMGKGHNAYADYCKALTQQLGLERNVIWVDEQTSDYYNYLQMSDAFVLTSRQDTFPLVMLEAAYLGKPIISFDSGGISEFLNGKYPNLIIKDRNLTAMAMGMIDIMKGSLDGYKRELPLMAKKISAQNNYARWIEIINSV